MTMADRATLARARDDLAVCADLVGRPLTAWQVDALRLRTRISVIVSPRQLGKTWALETLAPWFGFAHAGVLVLISSAGEEAALGVLRGIRECIAGSDILKGSVVDERAALVVLSNGSRIRSVPASEAQIRGNRATLAIADEAAQLPSEILTSALMPTIAAQPGGRLVLASSPLGAEGPFYALATTEDPDVGVFRWRRRDAPWIDEGLVAVARRSMPHGQFVAEFEGEFQVGDGDFLDVARAARVSVVAPEVDDVVIGVDPGQRDAFAVVAVGAALDSPARLAVVHCDTLDASSFTGAVDEGARLALRLRARVVSDQHSGAMLAERLRSQGVPVLITPWASSSGPRAVGVWEAYSALRRLLYEGGLELLDDPELLRELASLRVKATSNAWRVVSPRRAGNHGDRASALALAVAHCREPRERRQWLSEQDRAALDLAEALAEIDLAQRRREMFLGDTPPVGWKGGSIMGDPFSETW